MHESLQKQRQHFAFLKGRSEDVIRVKPSWIWDGWLDAGMAVGRHVKRNKITRPLQTSDKSTYLNWNEKKKTVGVLLRLTALSVCGCKLKFPSPQKKCETLSKASLAHDSPLTWVASEVGCLQGVSTTSATTRRGTAGERLSASSPVGWHFLERRLVKALWSKRSNPDTGSSPQPLWQQSTDGPCLSNLKQGWDAHRGHGGQERWIVRVWHFTTKRVVSHTLSLTISLSASPCRSLLSTEKAAAVLRKNYQSAAVGISVPEWAQRRRPHSLFGNLPGLTQIRLADGERAQWRRSQRNNLKARCRNVRTAAWVGQSYAMTSLGLEQTCSYVRGPAGN